MLYNLQIVNYCPILIWILQVIEHSPNGTFVAHVRVEDQDSGSNGLVTCVISSPYFLLQNSYEVR